MKSSFFALTYRRNKSRKAWNTVFFMCEVWFRLDYALHLRIVHWKVKQGSDNTEQWSKIKSEWEICCRGEGRWWRWKIPSSLIFSLPQWKFCSLSDALKCHLLFLNYLGGEKILCCWLELSKATMALLDFQKKK